MSNFSSELLNNASQASLFQNRVSPVRKDVYDGTKQKAVGVRFYEHFKMVAFMAVAQCLCHQPSSWMGILSCGKKKAPYSIGRLAKVYDFVYILASVHVSYLHLGDTWRTYIVWQIIQWPLFDRCIFKQFRLNRQKHFSKAFWTAIKRQKVYAPKGRFSRIDHESWAYKESQISKIWTKCKNL